MNEFLQWNDWWSQKYRKLVGDGFRYPGFKIALNLLHQYGGKTIVETGTTRARNDFMGAGMATILLGDYCKRYGARLHTVDILPEAMTLSKEVTAEFADAIEYVISDSVLYLKLFIGKIDLLYLDSMDCPEHDAPDSPRLLQSQQHQLNELQAAWDKLHEKSVILLDDNDFENGGKCKLTNQYLIEKGWRCLWNDKQSLWIL